VQIRKATPLGVRLALLRKTRPRLASRRLHRAECKHLDGIRSRRRERQGSHERAEG
jgi:hypothetical protein